MENTSTLITLTAPSCGGKSYLFNYIRDTLQLPCLISTTTRLPRAGEIDGVDYFFITHQESLAIEAKDGFAELVTFRGERYGVTKEEFHHKLSQGVAFLIVEATGIEHYVKPALDAGAKHLKYYIHTDFDIRLQRLKDRMNKDIEMEMSSTLIMDKTKIQRVQKTINSHMDRLHSMLTVEQSWAQAAQWDRILFGDKHPDENTQIILNDLEKINTARIQASVFNQLVLNQY